MGRHKPGGLCWSGNCDAIGIISIGADQNGADCKVCETCKQRINKFFMNEAEQFLKLAAFDVASLPKEAQN